MRYLSLALLMLPLAVAPVGDAWAKGKAHKAKAPVVEPMLLPEVKPILATYEIYVGGVHLLSADFMFQQQAARYHIQALVRTQGFWHRVLPWDTWFVSDGQIAGARFLPEMHKNVNVWKDSAPKTVVLKFDAKRDVTAEFDPVEGPDDNREIATAEQKRGALDPLSAVLQLLGDLAVNKTCVTTERVFDGKRVFTMTGSDQQASETDAADYGIYSGKARRCDVAFTMVAGSWKDKEHSGFWKSAKAGEGKRDPFQIWLAQLSPELPEMGVRLESPSIWGRIVVHLSGWHYATAEEMKPYEIMGKDVSK